MPRYQLAGPTKDPFFLLCYAIMQNKKAKYLFVFFLREEEKEDKTSTAL